MHRTHGYAGQMLSKSKGWSLIGLNFATLKQQRTAYAATMPNTGLQQKELEAAARLAKQSYDAAFEGMLPSSVTSGASRLQRALDDALRRQLDESIDNTSAS